MSTQDVIRIRTAQQQFGIAWKKIKERTGTPEIEITSLPRLSEKLWGIHKRETMIIGARTSQAKTSFALQLAWDCAKQGKRVYIFSLEMSEEALLERLFCQTARIPNHELLLNPKKYEEQAKQFIELLQDMPIIITYKIGSNVKQLWQAIQELPKADVVIVDYVQMIHHFNTDRLHAITEYVNSFRELCVKKDFAGILISQVNRMAMDKGQNQPKLWLLKGSGSLEETADTCLLLHWDFFYTNNENKRSDFIINIAKQRNGLTGTVLVDFHPQYYRFEERIIQPLPTSAKIFNAREVKE